MKKLMVIAGIMYIAAVSLGDVAMTSGPINSTASWGGSALNLNTGYRLRGTGTVSSADNFTLSDPAVNNYLMVGDQAGNNAKVNMDGGNFTVAGRLRLGAATGAAGTLNLSNGTLKVDYDLEVGRVNAGSTGIVNMVGGTLNVAGNILIGSSAISSESAIFNYTGGSVQVGGQFQMADGTLNYQLGVGPIVCNQRVGSSTVDLALIDLIVPGGYSHIAGTTNVIIRSNTQSGTFKLATDSGNVDMVNGAAVMVSGYPFKVINTATQLGLVSGTKTKSLSLVVISSL